MTDQPEVYTSAQFYVIVGQQIANGLPAPKSIFIRGDALTIEFVSITDREAWRPVFGAENAATHEQPYPLDGPYVEWTTSVSANWHGWHVTLDADEPITDEQSQQWIGSGQAASRAEYVAEQLRKAGEQHA